jgi:hypothetical protein
MSNKLILEQMDIILEEFNHGNPSNRKTHASFWKFFGKWIYIPLAIVASISSVSIHVNDFLKRYNQDQIGQEKSQLAYVLLGASLYVILTFFITNHMNQIFYNRLMVSILRNDFKKFVSLEKELQKSYFSFKDVKSQIKQKNNEYIKTITEFEWMSIFNNKKVKDDPEVITNLVTLHNSYTSIFKENNLEESNKINNKIISLLTSAKD